MTQKQQDTHAHAHTTWYKSTPTHLADAGDFLLGIFETLWTNLVAFHQLLPSVNTHHTLTHTPLPCTNSCHTLEQRFSALVSLLDKVPITQVTRQSD